MKTFNNVNEITEQDYQEYKQLLGINAYCADKKFITAGYSTAFLFCAGSIVGSALLGGFWLILFIPVLIASLSTLSLAIATNVGFLAKAGEQKEIRKCYNIPANLTRKQIKQAKKEIKNLKKTNQLNKLDKFMYEYEHKKLTPQNNTPTNEQTAPKKLILTARQRRTYGYNIINNTESNGTETITNEEETKLI